ncbi:hypothetical protein BpHYR1_034171 [Brachionus plicatilis]|uniref:Uncharacterized protein n=1 Tax=Brachionus plicatilis TaxID=10195 RepID=A0A3M7QKA8_BRAPC|nr:hypothetical protein BpHYR1_034171 [Brachionus plicatilis]
MTKLLTTKAPYTYKNKPFNRLFIIQKDKISYIHHNHTHLHDRLSNERDRLIIPLTRAGLRNNYQRKYKLNLKIENEEVPLDTHP